MKIITLLVIVLCSFFSDLRSLSADPKINFADLMVSAEYNNSMRREAIELATSQSLPVTILCPHGMIIDAKGVESGKVVYAVITDFANIFNNGYTAFYEDIVSSIDLSSSKIIYAGGKTVDNSKGRFTYELNSGLGLDEYLMVPDWTYDRVYLFSKLNGDLVDTAFIPSSPGILASPKMAMQHFNGKSILVSDQITDGVYRFDTSGVYIGLFAPNGGINTSILDNIRGIRYGSNNNLLVCVASGASQNTIQQFDTGGVHTGTFIGASNLNSPFDILIRNSDMLITNSSGTNRITRFDLSGNFLSNFYAGTAFAFPQQIQRLSNGNILVAAFSSPSGIAVLDSTGGFIRLMSGVTGARSVYLLDNGRYLATNGAGVHEIDSSTGSIIRTVVTGANFQYITLYSPGFVVSVGNNNSQIVYDYKLYQNYPNPFNPVTNISYYLPVQDFVNIRVTDITGKEVMSLANQIQAAGNHSVIFNGERLASGIYYYSIETAGFKQSRKMILLK